MNEVRYYLEMIAAAIKGEGTATTPPPDKPFVPQLLVLVSKAEDEEDLEVNVIRDSIPEHINNLLEACDEDMVLLYDPSTRVVNLLIV